MKSKYIIGEIVTSSSGLEIMVAIIFPEIIPHVDMAKVFLPECPELKNNHSLL